MIPIWLHLCSAVVAEADPDHLHALTQLNELAVVLVSSLLLVSVTVLPLVAASALAVCLTAGYQLLVSAAKLEAISAPVPNLVAPSPEPL